MLYRKMPKNGDELSILGFGCMRLPMLKDGTIDENRAITQMRYAIDNGVNYMDTAWNYLGGESERILGRALRNGYREKVRIATKLPHWRVESFEDMEKYLNEQIEKLGVDHIDYYLLHGIDGNSWDRLEKLGISDFLDKALQDRRIGNAGFSFHGIADDFIRIVDAYPWMFCLLQYNFLDQEYQAGTTGLKYAASKGLGAMIMEPLRGGNISHPNPPPDVKDIWDTAENKRTPVEWALRWVWNHPEVTVVLSGMNEEAHIEQNLAIADEAHPDSLTHEELQLVNQVAEKYKELMKVNCNYCGYCMPCPEGVWIPECFETYNMAHMFKTSEDEAKFRYAILLCGELAGQSAYASQCVECEECVDKCPQHIQIPEVLSRVAEEFEGSDMEHMVKMFLKITKS